MTRLDRAGFRTLVLGHSRDDESRTAVHVFAERWEAIGGIVLDIVDWPEEAASWLRPARRFTVGQPDGWVIAASAVGWAGMSHRLRQSTDWDPARTFSLVDGSLTDLADQIDEEIGTTQKW